MKKIMMTASALAIGATAATAGGIERSSQSVAILFEEGNYAELNFGAFNPDVSGTFTAAPGISRESGDMATGYGTYSLGYKRALSDKLDFAIVLDQPVGAKLNYGEAAAGYPLDGSSATITSTALTAMLRYKLPQNFSVYGGLRVEQVQGKADLYILTPGPAIVPYSLQTSKETDAGYLIGAAWEKPEIAARVALTYNSEITHRFDATETIDESDPFVSQFSTTVPESINLEFQTGVAKDTLVFGSVRWVHWKDFDISPVGYVGTFGDPLVSYSNNVTTYTLGVGRKFNEQWSGAVSLGYEKHQGGEVGNLGPTDGFKSIGLAASYQATENVKITGGVRYVEIGDAVTNSYLAQFSGNSGWGAGLRVGVNF